MIPAPGIRVRTKLITWIIMLHGDWEGRRSLKMWHGFNRTERNNNVNGKLKLLAKQACREGHHASIITLLNLNPLEHAPFCLKRAVFNVHFRPFDCTLLISLLLFSPFHCKPWKAAMCPAARSRTFTTIRTILYVINLFYDVFILFIKSCFLTFFLFLKIFLFSSGQHF